MTHPRVSGSNSVTEWRLHTHRNRATLYRTLLLESATQGGKHIPTSGGDIWEAGRHGEGGGVLMGVGLGVCSLTSGAVGVVPQ